MMLEDLGEESLRAGRQLVGRARNLVVISGAGMSADSGIATFRKVGSSGGWDAVAQAVATPEGFREDPQRVWSGYLHRRREALKAMPHAGYAALVAWEQRSNVTIITQNVDGLHIRSGSRSVIELHGTLFRFFCVDNQHPVIDVDDEDLVPRCPLCASYVRPAVVWFGEWLPQAALRASEAAVHDAHAILLIGTSLEVSSPKSLLRAAARRRTPIIEVNPEPTLPVAGKVDPVSGGQGLPAADVTLAGSASVVLPQLLRLGGADSPPS